MASVVLVRVLAVLGLLIAGAACRSSSSGTSGVTPEASAAGDNTSRHGGATSDASAKASATLEVSVHALVDLPRTSATQALSATAFDPATRTLYALQDSRPSIVPLIASETFDAFTVGAPLALTGRTTATWDGEGLVRDASGFVAVTVETGPTVERFDFQGKRTTGITFPSRFASQAVGNKGLESLTLSPSGRFLFTANESALTTDGVAATKSKGTTVRILRRELATGTDVENAYRTETLGAGSAPGDMGVSELAALSDDALLVLERGFQAGFGNTVRIFRVDFGTAASVQDTTSLSDATPVLSKTLVVDLASLPAGGAAPPAKQPNPILDNYESLALGPTLADGRRLVFVTSDDNAQASQVARVLVLAVRGL
jgi:hypothetical protein